jgi:membrane-associated protease RseP (regulator of RpoE activity)
VGLQKRNWAFVLRRVAPATLFLLTLASAFGAGVIQSQTRDFSSLRWVWPPLLFAASILAVIGAHAFGHYVVARRSNVEAWFPYFIPQPGIMGTSGAYVKLSWPIEDRRTLIRIFAAGPIAGFVVSALILVVGYGLSNTTRNASPEYLTLGDSLLTRAVQYALFPNLSANETVVLHPLGLAGYAGLNFGLWQLFPVGRFDGGRVMYGLVGYKRALVVSWVTIAVLVGLGMVVWRGWLSNAIFAAFTLIRLRRQHPIADHMEPLDARVLSLIGALLVILVVTFVPVPVRVGP